MSNTWVPFPDAADTALRKAARLHGEMILGNSGATIAKRAGPNAGGEFAQMPPWMKAAHAHVAGVRLAKAEEHAAHRDRPHREHALTAAQHRALAAEHEERAYHERHAGNHAGEHAHEHAALAHHHAARLASERDSDFPLASYRAREATRAANAQCQRQVSLEAHKAAGGDGFSRPAGASRGADSNFGSRAVREQRFSEPRSNPYAFHSSGRVSGGVRETGDDNSPDRPVHPLDFLLNPVNDPRSLNWSREDLGSPGRERSEGMEYPAAQPAKAAGIAPGESLTAFAKRLMSGSAGTPFAKSLDVAFEHRHELGEGLYRDYVAMRSNLADARSPGDWRRSDLYRDLVNRIERSAVSRLVKGELITALA